MAQSVYLKKRKRKISLFIFAKDRICFTFSVAFGGRLLVNLIDKSKFDIRLWSLLQRKHCKIALKSTRIKPIFSSSELEFIL